MQIKWRHDADKLTFIACVPLTLSLSSPLPMASPPSVPSPVVDDPRCDTDSAMLGDANLFLHLDADCPGADDLNETLEPMVIGELELMIAKKHARGHGHGRSAILCLLRYVLTHEEEIIRAFLQDRLPPPPLPSPSEDMVVASEKFSPSPSFEYFFVKISSTNLASICLFKSLGFTQFGPVNPFGEVELRRRFGSAANKPTSALEEVIRLMHAERFRTDDYQELPYHLNR